MNIKRTLAAVALGTTVIGIPAVALANVGGFDDVPDDHTHAAGIQWLVDSGITAGCDADSFCPSDNLTRAQMGTFLHKASGNAPGVAPSANATLLDGLDSTDFARNVEVVSTSTQLTNDSFENVTATCPAGKVALAGGYQIKVSEQGGLATDWFAPASGPSLDGTSWTASVRTFDGSLLDAFVTVHATCAAI